MAHSSSSISAQIRVAAVRHSIELSDDFRPSRDGFNFANHFPGLPVPLPLPGPPAPDTLFYGLCGGMCFAVVDFLAAGRNLPAMQEVPERRNPLYHYIFQRQLDSFGRWGRYIAKFVLWMILPDTTLRGIQRRTLAEIDIVRKQLDAGQKVMLGLMYNSIRQSLVVWQNHQVLAYAYHDLSPDLTAYLIYDPNRPGDDTGMILTQRVTVGQHASGEPVIGLRCVQRSNHYDDKPVRGFFPMLSYQPKQPPSDL